MARRRRFLCGLLAAVALCGSLWAHPLPVAGAVTPTAAPVTPIPAGAAAIASTPTPSPGVSNSGIAGGINAEPSMRPWRYSAGGNPDGWWCTPPQCTGGGGPPTAMIDNELTLASELGVADVRLEFPWPLIEPSRDEYDWSRADTIVDAAVKHGVVLQPVLVFTPSWAAGDTTHAPAAADFESFTQTFTSHYRGRFPVIELWNEPDGGHYWNDGEAAYVNRILIPGYRGARAGDPRIRVEMGAPGSDQSDAPTWLAGIFQQGGGNAFDIAAFHNYVGTAVPEASTYRTVLQAHGRGTTPIWLGEYGIQEDATADDRQVALMRTVLLSTAPIAMAQWYNLRDDDSVICCPLHVETSGHWGLLGHDGTSRKAGFQVMQAILGGRGTGTILVTPRPAVDDAPTDGGGAAPWIIVVGLGALAAGAVVAVRRRRR